MNTNKYKIIITDIAKEELEELYEYISKKLLAKEAADRLMEDIEKSIINLERYPYSYAKIHIKPRNEVYRKLVVENYIILYDIEEEPKQVVIYKVLYGGSDYLEAKN